VGKAITLLIREAIKSRKVLGIGQKTDSTHESRECASTPPAGISKSGSIGFFAWPRTWIERRRNVLSLTIINNRR